MPSHLKSHSISMDDYKVAYPGAEISTQAFRDAKTASLKAAAEKAGKTLRNKDKSPVDLNDCIECAICGKQSKQMTPAHTKTHGLTMAEYVIQYPDAVLFNRATRDKIASSKIGVKRSDEVRQNISKGRSGVVANYGENRMTDTVKAKISKAHMGKTMTQETRGKISLTNTGRKHSESTKQKFRNIHSERSDEEKAAIVAKIEATNRERYGGSIASNNAIRTKTEATNMTRYGGKSPASSPEVVAKMKATWAEKYPEGAPQRNPDVRAKIEQTNLDRYGKTHTMDIARETFLRDNDGLNPFQIEDIKAKIRKTLMDRYQVDHPAKIDGHFKKVSETTNTKYGRNNHSQIHISIKNLEILSDKPALTEMIEQFPLAIIAQTLGVNETTIAKRCDALGIKRHGTSIERTIAHLLDNLGVGYKMRSRSIISPKELDFVIPSHSLAIEVGGIYWHSDKFLSPSYHLRKMRECEKIGYRLLTIFEDEIILNHDIVMSRISYMLGMGECGCGARKIEVKPIAKIMTNDFLKKHHIQGGTPQAHINYGAFVESNLVAVMSFKTSWRLSHEENPPHELTRFATDGKNYPGIASKLMKAFVRDHNPETIISYADLRWSNGDLYHSMGFKLSRQSRPSYTYVRNERKRMDKTRFRKQKIEHLVPDGQSKTERQIMTELGYHRIYDCGHLRFEWRNETN